MEKMIMGFFTRKQKIDELPRIPTPGQIASILAGNVFMPDASYEDRVALLQIVLASRATDMTPTPTLDGNGVRTR